VHDVADNVKLLACELEDQGHTVLTALSGRQALGIASTERPDVVLLDVVMPEMDGIEVCRRLKEDSHTRTIPVILVTAKGLDDHVIAGLDAGADDYVPKPFNSDVLAARIRSALRVKESYEAVARTNEVLREEIAFRKRTEEELRKSEAKFRALYDSSGDAMILLDRDGFFDCNDAALGMFGCRTRAELCSKHPAELSPATQPDGSDSIALANQRIAAALEHGSSRFEWVHRRTDGSEFPTEVLLSPMELGERKVLQAVVRDITERKRSEEELRKLSLAVEQSPATVVITDPQGTIEYVNPKFTETTGYTAEEAIGENPRVLKSGETPPEQYRQLWQTITAGHVWRGEFHNRKKNRQLYWEAASISPIIGPKGDITHFVAVKEDITEQKRTEAALRASETKYKTLFDSSHDAIMTLTPDEGFLSGNLATVELFGCLDEAEFTSCGPADLSPEYQPDGTLSTIKAQQMMAIAMEEGSHFFEWTHKRLDGSEFFATVLLTRVEIEGRAFLQATVRDVSQQKHAEEALRRKDEELRESQKMEAIGGLAGGIAHEFNNLLQAISGYTHYALEGLLPHERRHQDLRQVLKATDRAAALTRQLLGFSRHQTLDPQNVAPNRVVRDLQDMVRPIIGEHIELEVRLDPAVDAVYADVGQLHQVLLNFCLNARDAMPSGGRLTVTTQNVVADRALCAAYPDLTAGPHVLLAVSDTGYGMSSEVQERIFEPFFTTKEVGEGTGLGLATVYGIVQQHGGTIQVESEPGRGSTFKVFLPAVEAMVDAERACEPKPVSAGTETILVAEDEPMVRDIAVRILQEAGYSILAAADGEEALRLFEANRDTIALVLLDVVMPKRGGHDVYREIKAAGPETKVVFCTGYDPETAGSQFIAEESLRLIQKPFRPEILLRTVREVLDAEEPCLIA